MDKSKAQFVLRSCRPGSADAADPAFREALEEASRDAALGAWFEEEQATDRAIAARLQQIAVPSGLAESILAAVPAVPAAPPAPRRPAWIPLALAASLAILATLAVFWRTRSNATNDFVHYRQDMIQRLEGRLVLSQQNERPEVLQHWLADERGLAGCVLPAGLQGRRSIGCRAWTWHGQTAGLLCFVYEDNQAVHLFIVPRQAVPAAPTGVEPQFEHIGAWETASWTQGELVYILAGQTDRASLTRLL